jgi:hypothetical protein
LSGRCDFGHPGDEWIDFPGVKQEYDPVSHYHVNFQPKEGMIFSPNVVNSGQVMNRPLQQNPAPVYARATNNHGLLVDYPSDPSSSQRSRKYQQNSFASEDRKNAHFNGPNGNGEVINNGQIIVGQERISNEHFDGHSPSNENRKGSNVGDE